MDKFSGCLITDPYIALNPSHLSHPAPPFSELHEEHSFSEDKKD